MRGLYAITDNQKDAYEILRGGAPILQLRDKTRTNFWEKARQIASFKKECPFIFIMNDDLEIAAELADGVHVGRDDPSIEECRKRLGPGKLVGYSAHSIEEAVGAERQGADYVAFGAIFPSPSKGPGHPIQGLEKLREVVAALKIPVVAIGGIDRTNIGQVKESGVSACAMISALTRATSITGETRYFVSRLS